MESPAAQLDLRPVYLATLNDVVTLPAWREICQTAVDLAREGDWRAREWVSAHIVGKPIERVESKVTMDAIVATLPAVLDIAPQVIEGETKE